MKATCKRAALVRELALLKNASDERAAVASLRDVLISGAENASEAVLRATNLEISLESRIEAKVIGAGAWCVPAKKLHEVVKSLPGDDVAFDFGSTHVEITSGSAKFKLATRGSEDFPQIEEPKGKPIAVASSALADGLSRTLFATANDDARYFLSGVLMELAEDGSLVLVSTDGHRLSYAKRAEAIKGGKHAATLIPRAAANLLPSLVESDSVAVVVGDSRLWFTTGKRVLSTRRAEGQFPQYEQVLKFDGTTRAVVSRAAFADALRRVGILSSEQTQSVRFEFGDSKIKVDSARADVGSASECVEAEISGPGLTCGFNGGYVVEWLAVAGSDKVAVTLKTPDTQCTLETVGVKVSEADRYVVMPMRL